jgi:hypothetical protein
MDEHKRKQAPSRGARTLMKLAPMLVVFMLGSLTTTAQAQDCVPSCRDGYLCHQGQCIEACNPPCAEGEQCAGDGQCVAAADSSAEAPASTYAVVDTSSGSAGPVDTGGKPSTAVPATFVGLGGFLLIAGGVTFATSEWNWDSYSAWWGTGQWVGVVLMTWAPSPLLPRLRSWCGRSKPRRVGSVSTRASSVAI